MKLIDASAVDYVIFSGQMQDLYFLDEEGKAIGNAVLYDDQRGADFVDALPAYVSERTSISLNGTIPVTKILWFKKNRPDILAQAKHILIGAKDYLIYRLTGKYVPSVPDDEGQDLYWLQRGYATVVPCRADQTAHDAVSAVEQVLNGGLLP